MRDYDRLLGARVLLDPGALDTIRAMPAHSTEDEIEQELKDIEGDARSERVPLVEIAERIAEVRALVRLAHRGGRGSRGERGGRG